MIADTPPDLQKHMAPFHQESVVFDAPDRHSFSIYKFKSIKSAVKLVLHFRRHKEILAAERYYNEALKVHGIGLFNDAENAYRECLRIQPDHEPARNNLAALYIRGNSFDLAEEQLMKAIEVRPKYHRAYYNLGLLMQHMERVDEAVIQYQKAATLKKDHLWSHIALGEIFADREDFPRAIQQYKEGLAHAKYIYPLLLRLAQLHFFCNEWEQSEDYLKKALKLKATPEVQYNLAWLLAVRDQDAACVNLFREAEKAGEGLKDALFNLALAQSFTGATAPSVRNMARYVKTHLESDLSVMIENLWVLVKVNPRNHHAYLQIASHYLEQSQHQKAIDTLNAVIRIDPRCVPAIQALADSYQALGRFKESIQAYRRMIKIAPEEVDGYLGLTKAYGAIENYAAAVPVIEKVLELDPNNTELNYQYATLMAQEGEFALAHKHYRIVASLDPNFPRIHKRLKMLEEELEDEDEITPWPKRS